MDSRGKTAIILMGGGMRSAHGGGFLYALATHLKITSPDIMIGGSGNAGNVLYFAAGQYESIKYIWSELFPSSKLISPLRFWRILNIDYAVDSIFKQLSPLDLEQLRTSSIRWFIYVTNYATGEPRYFGKSDGADIFETLRATAALPIFYRKKISLFEEMYIDGEIGATLVDHMRHAQENGAERILVINHQERQGRLERILLKIYGLCASKGVREALNQHESLTPTATAPGTRVLYITPRDLPARRITRNKQDVCATFDRGIEDALAHADELRTLLA